MSFELNARLEGDTFLVGDLPLCRVLMMNDRRYPWLILVPRLSGVTEIHQLDEGDRMALMRESCVVAEVMERLFEPHKMNVAALGNVVSQLHVHHVGRKADDPSWPGPVWGHSPAESYPQVDASARVEMLRSALELN